MSLTPTEFEQDGIWYRVKPLNVMEQWHLNRKLSPLIPPLIPVFLKVARLENGVMGDPEGVAALMGPFAAGIAGMNDEDAEYIINTCMSAIQRKVADIWTPVWAPGSRISQYQELNELSNVMPLVIKVITAVLGPFMAGLLTKAKSLEETPKETIQTQ
jgi:hypothetical protein